ncbi:MAG: DUF1127 domain-containing protein [Pseudomonadota bacterium]
MFASTHQTARHAPRIGFARRLGLFDLLIRLAALYRSRRALTQLTDAQLEDVGLTTRDAQTEASKPVWDVPPHWLS